jgi:hypothetical protein
MNGQLKVNYAHVTIANCNGNDEVLIHIDAKWLEKTKVSIICSSYPDPGKASTSKMIELDLYKLFGFKSPLVPKISATKVSVSKPKKTKTVSPKGSKKNAIQPKK